MHFRIIPTTITIAAILMCIKIADVVQSTEALAQQTPAPETKKEIPKPSEMNADEGSSESMGKPNTMDMAKKEEGGNQKGDKDKKDSPLSEVAGETVEHRYTPVEVELLQNLTRRREELDRWEKNIEIKEAALDATEKRLDDKIAQIDAMKKEVATLLEQYNEKEDTKIRSLVKIYENMKPKDAARIFDEVEMPILLLVIDKMSEKKTAPILAEMDPKKAKQITVQLAEQRKVSTAKLGVPTSTP